MNENDYHGRPSYKLMSKALREINHKHMGTD